MAGGGKVEDWKIKVSVLWLIIDIAYITDFTLGFMYPGALQNIIATGQILGTTVTPELLFVFALTILVPLLMAFLSLSMKNPANRWANIIAGAVYVVLWVLALIENSMQLPAFSIMITLLKLVASAAIVWYAWNAKQK